MCMCVFMHTHIPSFSFPLVRRCLRFGNNQPGFANILNNVPRQGRQHWWHARRIRLYSSGPSCPARVPRSIVQRFVLPIGMSLRYVVQQHRSFHGRVCHGGQVGKVIQKECRVETILGQVVWSSCIRSKDSSVGDKKGQVHVYVWV